MCWTWKNYVKEVMNVRELCKLCTESEKTEKEVGWMQEKQKEIYWKGEKHVRDVLIVIKLCNRCAASEKTMQDLYWM